MEHFFQDAEMQENPLNALKKFLSQEESFEHAKQYDQMRFVGYVLDIGYEEVRVITADPYKKAVGGVPRGSFLIMAPANMNGLMPHFTLLRVSGTAPTPLSNDVQQTYFELHKKSMPELDVFTRGELQWGALSTQVLGMFYADPNNAMKMAFSGDVNNVVSAHNYKVYAPDFKLLNLIVNGTVREQHQHILGKLRLTECQLPFHNKPQLEVDAKISIEDFKGFRTAMFGKTRLGKSNVVKLIAQGIIETTKSDHSVGQLIFDINGEYANDNPQDGNKSLRSAYEGYCSVFALTQRPNTPSKPLRLNFFEQPDATITVLKNLLENSNFSAIYVKNFSSVEMPSIAEIQGLPVDEKTRPARKVLYYWAILHKAGFKSDDKKLGSINFGARGISRFNPGFKQELRNAAYQHNKLTVPEKPNSLDELVRELEVINEFRRENKNDSTLSSSSSGKDLFDSDDIALLDFLSPKSGTGASIIKSFAQYHSPHASDFVQEILSLLDHGKTVILDLGNAGSDVRKYFSDMLSKAVFEHQEKKFNNNALDKHFIQLYFEEAHNLFPRDNSDFTGIYTRFAKEGAKFHIGMVYSTQSPSTINKELLAQTENFFVGHLSSQDEANALAKLQFTFEGLQNDILHSRTPGYMRMLTFSHRFVIPMQANKFEAVAH